MHHFKNFKGFANSELELFEPFTLLIGPNGSGKSNIIEAVELMAFIAHGRPLHEVGDIGRGENAIEVRGGLQSCPTYGSDYFTLEFSANIKFEGKGKPFIYSVTIQVKPRPRIFLEKLEFEDRTIIFQTLPLTKSSTSGDIIVECNNFARGGHKPRINIAGNRSALSQYIDYAKSCNKNKYDECIKIVNGIKNYLHSSFVFDPNPKLMRAYERIGNNILSRDGANLSAVLYSLQQGTEEDTQKLERILNWIKQLPEEPYQELGFVTTELNDVVLGFKEGSNGNFIDARMLSDGTLRSLAVLTALETVEEKSRVVIEEFDNGLHPSRVHVLVDAIASCCQNRKLNVFVTTHNPATLNTLQSDQLNGVVLCTRSETEQTFKLVKLNELPRYDELLERGRLGDLVTQRIIDQYLAPKFEENRKKKALDLLRSLS
ncbi:MAG: AAA family ATPase [Candidatus Latescibacteria bacterium]|nr:AAA family ATPase [Candidatus Latescibacterota bacterium]